MGKTEEEMTLPMCRARILELKKEYVVLKTFMKGELKTSQDDLGLMTLKYENALGDNAILRHEQRVMRKELYELREELAKLKAKQEGERKLKEHRLFDELKLIVDRYTNQDV